MWSVCPVSWVLFIYFLLSNKLFRWRGEGGKSVSQLIISSKNCKQESVWTSTYEAKANLVSSMLLTSEICVENEKSSVMTKKSGMKMRRPAKTLIHTYLRISLYLFTTVPDCVSYMRFVISGEVRVGMLSDKRVLAMILICWWSHSNGR